MPYYMTYIEKQMKQESDETHVLVEQLYTKMGEPHKPLSRELVATVVVSHPTALVHVHVPMSMLYIACRQVHVLRTQTCRMSAPRLPFVHVHVTVLGFWLVRRRF